MAKEPKTLADSLEDGSPLLANDNFTGHKEAIVQRLTRQDQARSVLITGASRSGKTALTRLVARDLQEMDYLVVSATSANLQAGQMYIGQLEQRVQSFLKILRQQKVVWISDSFHELELAGRHKFSPTSILVMILPDLANGNILVIGESPQSALSKLKLSSPRIDTSLDIIKLEESSTEATLELGKTGMPMEVIDDGLSLDLATLEKSFDQRVLGQPEAVTTLIERVAMIKAGLTDPTRPLGVFLFAGPTGTGKTEIAKTLATFLFGSEQRMIRLNMSGFQNPTSLSRLIGGPGEGTSFASRIRQQPFSLILLDEFEKADRHVWDLFLQVFDDGRLSDAQGNTADLRNTIIILTSNLGARDAHATSMGFTQDLHPTYQPGEIAKAIEQTFRKEFVNRIDRIVTFRPLSRETIRDILQHQLEKNAPPPWTSQSTLDR